MFKTCLLELKFAALASEELPFDNQVDRLGMVQLYNRVRPKLQLLTSLFSRAACFSKSNLFFLQLCRVAEADAVEACLGDSSASSRLSRKMHDLETMYEDLHRTLAVENLAAVEESEVHGSGS